MMDYYMIAGMVAVGIAVGMVGMRLAKDEAQLRRKRLLAKEH